MNLFAVALWANANKLQPNTLAARCQRRQLAASALLRAGSATVGLPTVGHLMGADGATLTLCI